MEGSEILQGSRTCTTDKSDNDEVSLPGWERGNNPQRVVEEPGTDETVPESTQGPTKTTFSRLPESSSWMEDFAAAKDSDSPPNKSQTSQSTTKVRKSFGRRPVMTHETSPSVIVPSSNDSSSMEDTDNNKDTLTCRVSSESGDHQESNQDMEEEEQDLMQEDNASEHEGEEDFGDSHNAVSRVSLDDESDIPEKPEVSSEIDVNHDEMFDQSSQEDSDTEGMKDVDMEKEENPSENQMSEASQREEKLEIKEQTPGTDPSNNSKTILDENKTETRAKEPASSAEIIQDEEALHTSVDHLFLQVTDMKQVKVKEVMESIEAEYDCTLTKAHKKVVRDRLIALIQQKVQPLQAEDQEDEEEESLSNENEVESDFDADEEGDSEEEYSPRTARLRGGKKRSQAAHSKKKTRTKKSDKTSPNSEKPTREQRQQMKKKLKAVRKQAELLRQLRLDELRVRNEELQAMQQDESRAERIAAKLETNTDEQIRHRFEQRVQLVDKLSQTRLAVIQAQVLPTSVSEQDDKKPHSMKHGDMQNSDNEEKDVENDAKGGSSDDSGSSDESEIEIIVTGTDGNKPPPVLFDAQKRNHALGLLTLADKGVPLMPSKPKGTNRALLHGSEGSTTLSPAKIRAAGGRAALQQRLKTQQRQMGNWWLARELNYTSVQDHVQDCKSMEEQKRQTCLQVEQANIQQRQQQLQKRLQRHGQDLEDDNDSEAELEFDPSHEKENDKDSMNPNAEKDMGDEENEEMAVAKELQQVEPAQASSLDPEQIMDSVENDYTESKDKTLLPNSNDARANTASSHRDVDAVNEDSESIPESGETLSDNDKIDTADVSGQDGTQLKHDRGSEESKSAANSHVNENSPKQIGVDDTTEAKERTEETNESGSGEESKKPKGPRNQGWKAMLEQDTIRARKDKRRKAARGGLVEEEADEEEEEGMAGLEDFGFTLRKKKEGEDDEEDHGAIDKDDLEGVVDELSDDEGDEEAGEAARKKLQAKEEKERHKEVLRRMREGYDGRRGGIGSGAGVRGVHRFDQLVAADNREDAKRLGLLNDDELDSEDEEQDGDGSKSEKKDKNDNDDEEDEAALVDKMLRDRFLHRSSVNLEENFSEDEEDQENVLDSSATAAKSQHEQEEQEQERAAKRFAKRARKQRLIEQFGEEEEFSQARLIDEDQSLRWELQNMKVCQFVFRATANLSSHVVVSSFYRMVWFANEVNRLVSSHFLRLETPLYPCRRTSALDTRAIRLMQQRLGRVERTTRPVPWVWHYKQVDEEPNPVW